jgi:predicted O-methyltransferase YrrM
LRALEIGTYQGVSAARIASVLAETGLLFCVDPWPETNGQPNPCWQICNRHLQRIGVQGRIRIVRGFSGQVEKQIPYNLDFAFIDGDHSWNGIATDWRIVAPRIKSGGVICLHDTVVPVDEPWRTLDSVRFYQEIISKDDNFILLEAVHSLSVLKKVVANNYG